MVENVANTLREVASQPLGLVFALILGAVSAAAHKSLKEREQW